MTNFNRTNFFPYKNIISLKDVVKILDDQIIKIDLFDNFKVKDISSLKTIRNNSLIFLSKKLNLDKYDFNNLCVITDKEKVFFDYKNANKILIQDLDESFNKICNHIFFHEDDSNLEDEFNLINGSYISNSAIINPNTSIGRNCFIGRGVKIGPNSIIKNNVVIKNSIIGSKVIISDNTTIGSTGFGFSLKKLGANNINPHIGIVFIEDNVRIGSCCTIDRGKIDFTFIGKNSMLDNQIHVAHNVIINSNACIAAQSGISGSVIIGNNLIAGGQSGFAGHIKVGDNVIVAAKSGVTKNIKDKSSIAGYPSTDINKWKKMIIKQRKEI